MISAIRIISFFFFPLTVEAKRKHRFPLGEIANKYVLWLPLALKIEWAPILVDCSYFFIQLLWTRILHYIHFAVYTFKQVSQHKQIFCLSNARLTVIHMKNINNRCKSRWPLLKEMFGPTPICEVIIKLHNNSLLGLLFVHKTDSHYLNNNFFIYTLILFVACFPGVTLL